MDKDKEKTGLEVLKDELFKKLNEFDDRLGKIERKLTGASANGSSQPSSVEEVSKIDVVEEGKSLMKNVEGPSSSEKDILLNISKAQNTLISSVSDYFRVNNNHHEEFSSRLSSLEESNTELKKSLIAVHSTMKDNFGYFYQATELIMKKLGIEVPPFSK